MSVCSFAYRTALPVYRSLRRLKNQALNLIDPPVVVLLYHRVAALSSDPELLAVSPENFRAQMQFLKRNFPLARFEEDWSAQREPSVAITFDDGYADNAIESLPILEEVGVPATFFISAGHIGTPNEFWWYQMENILLSSGEFPVAFRLDDPQHGRTWPTETPTQRHTLYATLNSLAQKIDLARLEGWMQQLRAWSLQNKSATGVNRSLTKEELQILAESSWTTIGAHTLSHCALSPLNEEQQRHEIIASKVTIERIIGKEVRVFSYPFGNKSHYNRISLRLCREAKFVKVASNFPGQAHRWTDPYQIPRQLVRNWDLATFTEKMRGFWA